MGIARTAGGAAGLGGKESCDLLSHYLLYTYMLSVQAASLNLKSLASQ